MGYPNRTQSFFEFCVWLCEQKKCYKIISKTFTGKVLIISYSILKKKKGEYKQTVCKASLKIRQNTAVNYQFDVGLLLTALNEDILNIHFRSFFVLYTLPMLFWLWIWCLNLFFFNAIFHFLTKTKNRQNLQQLPLLVELFHLQIEKNNPIQLEFNFQSKTTVYM